MLAGFMEDDDNISNSSDGDQKRIVQQRSNISSMRKESIWYDCQHFPDSLLIEILARLPVKTIFRFKSVCKHWKTLISHPFFSRFYHSILNSNSNAAALLFRIMDKLPNFKKFFNIPEIHSSSVLFLYNPDDVHQYDRFMVLNRSNGLILCRLWLRTETVYYICDPLTRNWITIPIPKPGSRYNDCFCEGLITRVNEDHMLTGYTLIRIPDHNNQSNYLNIEMFSSETGEWIYYKLHCAIPINWFPPVNCYGAIHWKVDQLSHGMVAFDPYKDPKSVRLIPPPNDRDLHPHCCCSQSVSVFDFYGECQGTLRYFQVACNPTNLYFLSMWAMKDYEKGEWCCEFKVRRSDVHSTNLELSNWLVNERLFFPLSLHPLNPNVVYLTGMHPQRILSYDVLNRRLDVAFKPPIDNNRSISQYSVIPCVLPRWPLLV